MARIDKELALNMMQSGKSDSQIAEHFGTTRQAVNLVRQSLVRENRLNFPAPGQPASSLSTSTVATPMVKEPPEEKAPYITSLPVGVHRPVYPNFDQITDWMVNVIKSAAEVQQLRRRCELAEENSKLLQVEIAKLRQEVQELNAKLDGNVAKANGYQEAVQKLELPPSNN
jgi:hypothetical protein